MERRTTRAANPFSAVVATLVLVLQWLPAAMAGGSRTCFSTDGSVKDYMYACYPDRTTSHCCADGDFCLDNGLCLDAGGDNDFTVQGCTDENWGEGCGNYCKASEGGNIYLAYCGVSDWYAPGNYCCGDREHDCCNSTVTSSFFTVPLFTTVFKAPEVLAAHSTTAPSSAPTTPMTAATTTPVTIPATEAATADTSSGNNVQAIAIAVPLGALAIGAIGLVAWLLLRKRVGPQADEHNANDGNDSGGNEAGGGAMAESIAVTGLSRSKSNPWSPAQESGLSQYPTKSEDGSAWGSPQQHLVMPLPLQTRSLKNESSFSSRAELHSPHNTHPTNLASPQELSAELNTPLHSPDPLHPSSAAFDTNSPTLGTHVPDHDAATWKPL